MHSLSGNRKLHGGFSSVGRASDCGSECHGFEPHIPPTDILHGCLFLYIGSGRLYLLCIGIARKNLYTRFIFFPAISIHSFQVRYLYTKKSVDVRALNPRFLLVKLAAIGACAVLRRVAQSIGASAVRAPQKFIVTQFSPTLALVYSQSHEEYAKRCFDT